MTKNILIILIFCLSNVQTFSQSKIDKQVLDTLLKIAELTQTDGLVVFKDGQLYGEYYFGKKTKKIETMSSTKSIVNLAIGKLITDSLIKSIDQPIYDFYPEWKQGMKKNVTIRHLLNHTSGIQNFPLASVEIYPSPDFVKLALAAEIVDTPGTKFAYNNKAVNLLVGVVKYASRMKMDNYLYEKIFEPLGINDYDWTRDDEGNPHGMSGLQIYPKDMAKLGQLFLNKGQWEGRQIISSDWFLETGKPTKLKPACGLLWWIEYDTVLCTIDDAQIEKLKKIGFDEKMLDKVRAIKGTYESAKYNKILNDKIVNSTEDWNSKYIPLLVSNGMTLSRNEYKNIIGYSTRGTLGNYMAVYPKKNLVVVRMISWESFLKGKGSEDGSGYNNFSDFLDLAKKLVK